MDRLAGQGVRVGPQVRAGDPLQRGYPAEVGLRPGGGRYLLVRPCAGPSRSSESHNRQGAQPPNNHPQAHPPPNPVPDVLACVVAGAAHRFEFPN